MNDFTVGRIAKPHDTTRHMWPCGYRCWENQKFVGEVRSRDPCVIFCEEGVVICRVGVSVTVCSGGGEAPAGLKMLCSVMSRLAESSRPELVSGVGWALLQPRLIEFIRHDSVFIYYPDLQSPW